ncbi:MAG: zinc-ribbon domain-containing protein [Oscillospiraceae bacterium]|nr:zinc-ribbon domain-containing protein [Oscillospiraceae bacterium]MBR7055610.1 zinc-ribbon domain-containing protein [Oscillospiraceae bacterium]
MAYCSQCGTQNTEGARFCRNCGQGIDSTDITVPMTRAVPAQQNMDMTEQQTLSTLLSKMKTSSGIWTGIGIYQLVAGLATLMLGYGVLSIILGIWNIVQSSKEKKTRLEFEKNPVGIVAYFERNRTSTIVFVFLNLFFGAFLGVIGSVYDLTVNSYALNSRDTFDRIERWAKNRPYTVGVQTTVQQ